MTLDYKGFVLLQPSRESSVVSEILTKHYVFAPI